MSRVRVCVRVGAGSRCGAGAHRGRVGAHAGDDRVQRPHVHRRLPARVARRAASENARQRAAGVLLHAADLTEGGAG